MLDEFSLPAPGPVVPHPLPEGMSGVDRLIEVATNEHQRALVALCGYCGLRVAEAIAVRPSHFNRDERTLTVRGKGDKTRVVPVSNAAWSVLEMAYYRTLLAGDNDTLVGLQDAYARRIITILGKRAGLSRNISSHDLRATFGTTVYERKKDIRLVQLLLGHQSSVTTEGYIGVNFSKMRDAVEGL